MADTRPDIRTDRFLDGSLMLLQASGGHRAGTDAVLLAAAIADPEGVVIDAGGGVGAAGLMLAARAPGIDLTLVDIDPLAVELARENIGLNGFAARARAVAANVLTGGSRRAAGLHDGCADLVLCNPPWLTAGRSRASPDARRALAHVAAEGGLAAWVRAMAALAKPGGRMAMIAPAAALREVLTACEGRFGDLALMPVHAREGEAAIRLLMCARKGSRGGARILPGLTLHDRGGAFTPRAEALHRGKATLDLK